MANKGENQFFFVDASCFSTSLVCWWWNFVHILFEPAKGSGRDQRVLLTHAERETNEKDRDLNILLEKTDFNGVTCCQHGQTRFQAHAVCLSFSAFLCFLCLPSCARFLHLFLKSLFLSRKHNNKPVVFMWQACVCCFHVSGFWWVRRQRQRTDSGRPHENIGQFSDQPSHFSMTQSVNNLDPAERLIKPLLSAPIPLFVWLKLLVLSRGVPQRGGGGLYNQRMWLSATVNFSWLWLASAAL